MEPTVEDMAGAENPNTPVSYAIQSRKGRRPGKDMLMIGAVRTEKAYQEREEEEYGILKE